jgi:subtilisin family serine protease
MSMSVLRLVRGVSVLLLCAAAAFAGDSYIIRVNPSLIGILKSLLGFKVDQVIRANDGLYVVSAASAATAGALLSSLQTSPLIVSVEANATVLLPELSPGFPKAGRKVPVLQGGAPLLNLLGTPWIAYLNQPANRTVRIAEAHGAYGLGNSSAVVAVIDTGIDHTHPALLPVVNFWQGWDFTRGTADGSGNSDLNQETTPFVDQETTPFVDGSGTIILNQETTPFVDQETTPFVDNRLPPAFGHGTMVAGIVHLVAPHARLLPIKSFSSDGSGTMANVLAGIYFAADRGANIINMSFSSSGTSKELQRAIAYAQSRGIVCVASVANDGSPAPVYPAALDKVIGIASTDKNDVRSTFSNYGTAVQLAAPGEAIVTTFPRNRYAVGWGTSFSTPYVTGAVALMQSLRKQGTDGVISDLRSGADPAQSSGLGAGRLNVFRATANAR